MKTPPLLSGFAVASTVAFAGLKDPAIVAREWNENAAQSPSLLTEDLSLKGQTAPVPRLPSSPITVYEGRSNARPPRDSSRLPESLYDAPNYRTPEKLPSDRPRGAVPWEYNGEVYWLVPLGPATKD